MSGSVDKSKSWDNSNGSSRDVGGTVESLGDMHKTAGRRSDTFTIAPSTQGVTVSVVCDPVARIDSAA